MARATAPDALTRATEQGIRVARLSEDTFRAQSSEPHLRGPYLLCGDGAVFICQCAGAGYAEACKHAAAVAAALAGVYPWSDASEIAGPPEFSATRRETREERIARLIAEQNAASAARRLTDAATLTDDDYRMFG